MSTIVAFMQQRTWEQMELARHVGVQKRALRRVLHELSTKGVPLVDDKDPPHVYWSVPAWWLPGATTLNGVDVATCVRLLARLPRTKQRDALLRRLVGPNSTLAAANAEGEGDSQIDDANLRVVEDSLEQRVALSVTYRSASTGRTERRGLSVQHVAHGDHPRFVAVCHRDDRLKWFRVDRIENARLSPTDPFRARSLDEIRAFLAGSFDSYRSGPTAPVAFTIRNPEARWAISVMPTSRFTLSRSDEGVRVEGTTAGLHPLARFLVGLGDAVTIEPGPLRDEAHRIARAALRAIERATPGVRRATARLAQREALAK